ncbi:MAG: DNA repair protein RadA [bacterium]
MFVCKNCGYKSAQTLGQCPYCSKWGTFTEEKSISSGKVFRKAVRISELSAGDFKRISAGSAEVDAVLGGGIVQGSVILLAGPPGIGKSTVMLQIASSVSGVLYVTGEESLLQVCLRSKRIRKGQNIQLLATQDFEEVTSEIKRLRPAVVMIDSIQSLKTAEISGFAAAPSMMKEVTAGIVGIAKTQNVSFILSGHITKEGILQGPKILEHMVDVVLYLDESPVHGYRILHSTKNRFGNTQEFSVFHMCGTGIEPVADASKFFLAGKRDAPGSVAVCACQGSSPFAAEIQALINPTAFQYPRRQVTGLDLNRVYLIIAILERFLSLRLSSSDIYLNAAGGMKINEPAADLAIAVSIISAFRKFVVPQDFIFSGEIGLTGEIRNISRMEDRVRKAGNLGFKKMVLPPVGKNISGKMKLFEVKNIKEAAKVIQEK